MKFFLLSVSLFLSVNYCVSGQKINKDSTPLEPVIITLDCRIPDAPAASYLIFYENKNIFIPSDFVAEKRKELLSTINPVMIDSITVKRNEEALKNYDLPVASGLIVMYLNTTFKNSVPEELLSTFKSKDQ